MKSGEKRIHCGVVNAARVVATKIVPWAPTRFLNLLLKHLVSGFILIRSCFFCYMF